MKRNAAFLEITPPGSMPIINIKKEPIFEKPTVENPTVENPTKGEMTSNI